MKFAQISDCHIGGKSCADNLKKIAAELKNQGIKIVVASGDISENGVLSEYVEFQYIMRDFEVFALAGNHDNIANMRKVFTQKQLQNFTFNTFNIQLIPSKIENQVHGNISINDIDSTLKQSILITHHPVVSMQSEWDDSLSCENRDEVIDYIKDKNNINTMCFGHAHEAKDFKINNVNIYSCPSTAYQFDGKNAIGCNLYELDNKDKEINKTTIWV